MPGFTHMQPAQPVTFGHHCLAYIEMFERDRGRFDDAKKRLNESPLGAAALAGTPYPIDRDGDRRRRSASRGPMRNSLDAVSARDFALEYLSRRQRSRRRICRASPREIVLWVSPAFGFVTLSDAFTTGSSIMPQKRNPDAAELVRAKTGRVLGEFVALATVMKGLALAYAKDLQEDKEAVFAAADALEFSSPPWRRWLRTCAPIPKPCAAPPKPAIRPPPILPTGSCATLKQAVPRRASHRRRHRQARRELGRALEKLPLADMQKDRTRHHEGVYAVLSLEASVNSRMSFGGTAPERVREQIGFWREKLK